MDAAGYLYYRDPYNETIKSGEEKVSAQEIEVWAQQGRGEEAERLRRCGPEPGRVNCLRISECLIEAAGRLRVAPVPVGPDHGEPGMSTLAAAGAGEHMMAAGLGSTWWQYLLLFLAVAASWAGVPFIGTAALGAAAVAASQRRLDLTAVIVVATMAGEVGGIGGYAIGRRRGRQLLERPGRHRARREKIEARGERLYARWAGWPCSFPALRLGHGEDAAVPVRRLEPAGLARVDGVGDGQRLRDRQARRRTPHVDSMSPWFALGLAPVVQPWALIAGGAATVTAARLSGPGSYLVLALSACWPRPPTLE